MKVFVCLQILGRFNRARAARLTLPHFTCQTPLFMPVGTQGLFFYMQVLFPIFICICIFVLCKILKQIIVVYVLLTTNFNLKLVVTILYA